MNAALPGDKAVRSEAYLVFQHCHADNRNDHYRSARRPGDALRMERTFRQKEPAAEMRQEAPFTILARKGSLHAQGDICKR